MCNNYILQRWFDVWIKRLLMAANPRGVVLECIVALGMILYSEGWAWGVKSNRKEAIGCVHFLHQLMLREHTSR